MDMVAPVGLTQQRSFVLFLVCIMYHYYRIVACFMLVILD